MLAGLGAPTERDIEEVDSIDVDDGEGPRTVLGVRAYLGRMMAQSVDITSLPERGFLKESPIPFLCSLT